MPPWKQTVSIYNKNTRFLLVDIETAKASNKIINDISFGIWSRSEGFVGKVGYLVEENRKHPVFYGQPKEELYAQYIEQGIYSVKPFASIMDIMNRIINKYQPTFATAYNSGFDFPRIRQECEVQGIACPIDRLTEFDLYVGACETLGQQKTFKRFVDENGFLTEKGNRKSGAETMFRYLRQWLDFEEEHTGYADVEIEAYILDRVQRQKKKLSMRTTTQAWKLVQG